MGETVNESVSVLASFAPKPRGGTLVKPHLMKWRDRRYKVDQVGMYHPERRGVKQVHIFSFSCGSNAFKVELDPETLKWTLTEVYYGA